MTTKPAHWFTTTPEAVLRAESMLVAFAESRVDDIGAILAQDYTAEGASPLQTVVALLLIADRGLDYAATETGHTQRDLIREAARVVAQAYYQTTQEEPRHD